MNTITDIHQDKRGYLWIGTRDGLNRYDGVEVEIMNLPKNANNVFSILSDKNGFLWLGTYGGGVVRFNSMDGTYRQFLNDPQSSNSLSDNIVNFLDLQSNRFLWIQTRAGGMDRLDIKSEHFVHFDIEDDEKQTLEISYFLTDKSGNNWIGTRDKGLYKLNKDTQSFDSYPLPENPTLGINHLYEDNEGIIWVSSDQGLYRISRQQEVPLVERLESIESAKFCWEDNDGELWTVAKNYISRVGKNLDITFKRYFSDFEVIPTQIGPSQLTAPKNRRFLYTSNSKAAIVDSQNDFWFMTTLGLVKYHSSLDYFNVPAITQFAAGPLAKDILSLYKDGSGSVWIGTIGSGLLKFVPSHFQHYRRNINSNPSFDNNLAARFFQRNNEIWIARWQGTFEKYNQSTKQSITRKVPGIENPISDILPLSNNEVWLAGYGDGLIKYNFEDYTFQVFQHNPDDESSISSNVLKKLYIDEDQNFWIVTSNGVDLFNPKTGIFESLDLNLSSDQTMIDGFTMLRLNESLFIGSLGQGLFVYNFSTGQSRNYTSNDPQGINNDLITVIHPDLDNDHLIWLGTYGGGLNAYDTDNQTFTPYRLSVTSPFNEVIYGILEDDFGRLWIGSNEGITAFDKKSKNVIHRFDENDGVLGDFTRGSYYKLQNGEILFGGLDGYNRFDPSKIGKSDYQAPLSIRSLATHQGKEIVIYPDSMISLDHDENFFDIRFSAMDFRNPGKIQYKYRLSGLVNTWINTTSRLPVATFTNLDPGNYTFEVKATNSDGIWMDQSVTLNIIIETPFWMTWWFRGFVIVVVLGLFYLIFKLRIKVLEDQRNRLNKLVNERTQELQTTNSELTSTLEELKKTQSQLIESEKMASLGTLSSGIGHEINNPLNFIKGGATGLSSYLQKLSQSDENTSKFISIINEGVSRASNIVGKLSTLSRDDAPQFESCNVQALINDSISLLSSQTPEEVNIRYEAITEHTIVPGNAQRLQQVFFNIIQNAIHAVDGKGSVDISTHNNDKFLSIIVKDTGEGIPKENLNKIMDPFFTTKPPDIGTGLGLAITYKIVEDHMGSLKFDSEIGEGTTVTIELPSD